MGGITPRPGGSGSPAEFVGRADTTRWAVEQWRRGQDLLLSDPRRMGKTEWLRALPSLGLTFPVVNIDYEGVDSTESFLIRTAAALHRDLPGSRRLRERLSSLFEGLDGEVGAFGVRIKAGVTAMPRTRLLEQTIDAVERRADGTTPVVVAMDEITAAVINIAAAQGPDAARILLETLRRVRQGTRRVRWVLSGSVGMHHALRIAHATTGAINDLRNVPFGPLQPEDARDLARRLIAGIGAVADEAAIGALVAQTDGIPYFLHAIAARPETTHAGRPIAAVDVTGAVEEYLRSRDDSQAATHLLTRIDTYYGELSVAAYRLLDQVAAAGAPVAPDAGIAGPDTNSLVDLLVDDHYVTEDPAGRLSWRYPLLRRIWATRRRLR